MKSTTYQLSNDAVLTANFNKIQRFLDGTRRRSQFSVLFGASGLGKSFAARCWTEKHPNSVYVRAPSRSTAKVIGSMISEAIFNSPGMRQSHIVDYFLNHPGAVLIIDEAVHLLGNYNYNSITSLDFIRDLYDEVTEAGGHLGTALIFTKYNLQRLRECPIASFLAQFVNRMDNHLDLGTKLSYKREIVPHVQALLPGCDDSLCEFFKSFPDIRSIRKRIMVAKDISENAAEHPPVTVEMLAYIEKQFRTGEYDG